MNLRSSSSPMTGSEILRTMSHWVKSRARSLKIIWEGDSRRQERQVPPQEERGVRVARTITPCEHPVGTCSARAPRGGAEGAWQLTGRGST